MLCSGPGGTVRMDALMYEIIIIFKSALGLFFLRNFPITKMLLAGTPFYILALNNR